jgi:hypothetical protein
LYNEDPTSRMEGVMVESLIILIALIALDLFAASRGVDSTDGRDWLDPAATRWQRKR